jgi:hypothetical protein
MPKYIIMKSSRAFDSPTAEWAYRGLDIILVDTDAEADAKKLTEHNPAGFVVLEMKNADMCV